MPSAGQPVCLPVVNRGRSAEVAFVPGDAFYLGGMGQEYVRLNFSLPAPDRIRDVFARLMEAVRDVMAETRDMDRGQELEITPIV